MSSGNDRVAARSRAAELVEAMASSASLMPVHEMEALVALGSDARGEVARAIEAGFAGGAPAGGAPDDPLYLIVVAGLLGGAELVPACLAIFERPGADPGAGIAAMEALARIGEASLPALARYLSAGPGPVGRIHAYGALGLIPAPEAGALLRAALETDTELAWVAAAACARRGDLEAFLPMQRAYARAHPDARAAFEDALRILSGADRPEPHPFARNWRVRYRRRPAQNWGIEAGWESQALLDWRLGQEAAPAALPAPPVRPLEEILAGVQESEPDWISLDGSREAPRGYCRRCGRREEGITGMRICPALARELISTQRALLAKWQTAGESDLFAHLDEMDLAVAEGLRRLASLAGAQAEGPDADQITRRLDRLAAEQRTLYFLVEEGCSTTGEGITLLSTLARRAPRSTRADLEAHGIVRSWRP